MGARPIIAYLTDPVCMVPRGGGCTRHVCVPTSGDTVSKNRFAVRSLREAKFVCCFVSLSHLPVCHAHQASPHTAPRHQHSPRHQHGPQALSARPPQICLPWGRPFNCVRRCHSVSSSGPTLMIVIRGMLQSDLTWCRESLCGAPVLCFAETGQGGRMW